VKARARLIPYLLLGVLSLGAGLGLGLGLSEASVTYSARFYFSAIPPGGTCTTFSTAREVGVTCRGPKVAPYATFESLIPRGEASCLPEARLVTRGPNALEKAVA
jgi:hypothetical protein